MHLGLMLECEQREGATQQQALNDTFELADAAESLGFDAVWLAERHFASRERIAGSGGSGAIPSFASAPIVLAAALAARTARIRIGLAVSLLPLVHPIRLAEELATLDHISRGRLEFGAGRSSFQSSYEGYAIPYEEARGRFQECLAIVLQAWTQESVAFTGNYYAFSDVCVVPKPLQTPHPPVRVAATSSDTFPQMGALGYPIFAGVRSADLAQVAQHLRLYRQAWRQAGHGGEGDAYLRIPVYVAPTAERAYEEPRESTLASYRRLGQRYAESVGRAGTTPGEQRALAGESLSGATYDELLENRLAYGTPDAVAKKLLALMKDLKLTGFVIEPNVGGTIATARVTDSIRLFAETVAPRLRG
jgi:alkanesulfonate monooxygenase SsuD/methylene tetrahydromethanopterin reductase-like flavin-dependent oxidoreductase (luciferase family)